MCARACFSHSCIGFATWKQGSDMQIRPRGRDLFTYIFLDLFQLALSSMGAAGGPMAGIMFLGATNPIANWIVRSI